MKQINKILCLIILCHCSLFSYAYSKEPVLTFRLVHPDHDNLSYVPQSEAKVDKRQYELFTKGKENYWVDRKIELCIKDFKDAKIQEMVMDSSKAKWETIEASSSIPSDASCRIVLYFSKNSQKKIENLSERNIRRRLAIIYNNQLLMAPIIVDKISGETITVVGISYEEAQRLKTATNE